MAATKDRDSRIKASARRKRTFDVAASTTIFKGTMVVIDASGYAIPATAASGRRPVGIATEQADNSGGSAGDITVEVETGVHLMENDDLVQADEGSLCYLQDDQTVGKLAADSGAPAGIVDEVVSGGAYVYFSGGEPAADDVTAEDVDAAGAVSNLTRLTRLSVDGTAAFTLANGLYIGQHKHIVCVAATNTPVGTLTPTSLQGFTSIVFDAAGESVVLVWNGTAWDPIAVAGATLTA